MRDTNVTQSTFLKNLMKMTKRRFNFLFVVLGTLFWVTPGHSKPEKKVAEQWLVAQAQLAPSPWHVAWLEWIRRDRNALLGGDGFLDLYRVSYGWRLSPHLTLTAGFGWIDFKSTSDELRLHQFVFYQTTFSSLDLQLLNRTGLEQRFLENDPQTLWRLRNRIQINWPQSQLWSFSAYDEFFYSFSSHPKIVYGLNENRWGVGIRRKWKDWQAFIYWGEGFLEQPHQWLRFEWWQFQIQAHLKEVFF
ncbi:MAG: DUF2490 domain-containing protein [Bdellovibrionaceae bacterium]|nr:DUF2490 domain-containing protein [Pseudobdellovibrionaceae bacterium]MDW8191221.1 DUF2490 domain-containing protein [Pseudobdellovibrionaceae bacterium]